MSTPIETTVVMDLSPRDLEDLVEELRAYHAIYSPLFQRREQRKQGTLGAARCQGAGDGDAGELARARRLVGAALPRRNGGVEEVFEQCSRLYGAGDVGASMRDALADRDLFRGRYTIPGDEGV